MAAAAAQASNETRQAEADRLLQQGAQQHGTGQFSEALQSFQAALKLYQKIGSYADVAITLTNIGRVYSSLGQYPQALKYHQQALSLVRGSNVRVTLLYKSKLAEAITLNGIGAVYLYQGRYSQALEAFQHALNIAKAIGSLEQEQSLLANIGHTYKNLGQPMKALAYYKQALSLFKEKVGTRQSLGIMLNDVGSIFIELGHSTEALKFLQQSLDIFREIGDSQGESLTLNNMGDAYLEQGHYIQALAFYQQALGISRKIGDRVGEDLALSKIGYVYFYQGQNTQALEIFQQSLANRRQIGDRSGESAALNNLGLIYIHVGQYAQALESFQQVLKIEKSIGNHHREATALRNIGQVYTALGQPTRALEYYQQSLIIAAEDVEGIIVAVSNIGRAYLAQKQYAEALKALQQSLSLSKKIANPTVEVSILNQIGNVYISQKQDAQALNSYQRALGIARKIGNQHSEAAALNGIGLTYLVQQRHAQALESYQQALGIVREIGDRHGEAAALGNIGDLLYIQRKPELAIVFYKQSVNTWESIRRGLRKLSTEQQQSFTNTVADSYRNLANLLLQQNRVLEAQRVLDLLKVQELEDYLRDVRGNAQTAQGVEYWQPEQRILELYNRAIAQGNELAQLRAIPDAKLTPKQRQRLEQLVAAESEILQSFDAFTNRPEVAAAVQQLSQTSKNQNVELTQLNSLQNNLRQIKQNAVLLYPLILDNRLELVLVTPNSPPIRRPVNVRREDLNRVITEFLQALKDPTSDATKPAQKLYQWLIQPIEADLKAAKAQTIVYAPDGQLRYVPLAALHDGKQWLTQRFRVNYITAASLTDFDDPPQAQIKVLAAAFSDASRQFTVKAGDRSLTFAGLPYAKTEVENLAATIPGTTELLNSAFNRKSTLPRMGSYTLVHLATHAAFLPGQPEESFVLFGDGDRLSLRDLKQLNLPNVDLVVLSACETGVGNQLGNGIEILGFGFQMQRTGARAAIASLWQVNDGGTQVLMNDFYAILQRGKISKAEALRQAQIAMITQNHPTTGKGQQTSISPGMRDRLTHPYYWAPFILIGNGL